MIKSYPVTQTKLQNNPNNLVGTDPFLTINTHLSGMVARVCPATQPKPQNNPNNPVGTDPRVCPATEPKWRNKPNKSVALHWHGALVYQGEGEARLAPTVGRYWGVL
jgi:hypothetical protein